MAMAEHDTAVSITLSCDEVRDILEKMNSRPRDFVMLTVKHYHIEDERAENKITGFIYGEGPDVDFEL
jgi:hypothetical protein